jgi:AcrR family transcriptional regulator
MVRKVSDDSIFNDLFGDAKSRKGARTIANILDACLDLIEKEGWPNLTQEKVAERAGIKAGTLRYYYPVKEDLVAAALKRSIQYISDLLDTQIDTALSDPLEKFLDLIDAILVVNEKINEVLVWELWAYSAHDKTANMMKTKYYDWITKKIADLIKELKPELDKETCLCRAAAITSLSDGALIFVGKSQPKRMELKNIRDVFHESMLKIAGIDPVEKGHPKKFKNAGKQKKLVVV